jgi:cysteine synthase
VRDLCGGREHDSGLRTESAPIPRNFLDKAARFERPFCLYSHRVIIVTTLFAASPNEARDESPTAPTSGTRIDALIGRTPVVRLDRLTEPGDAEVWVKLEGLNPGASIKDRTALGMVLDAERRGILKPGGMIVEPTSGNTGIGLAQLAAARGYRLILCLPSSMSEERKRTLRAYGAELVLTDPKRRMLAAIEEAERIRDQLDAWMPNQFTNPANPRIHYETTGPELWEQMHGRIDAFVYGSGTGGTISGVGRYLKERNPSVLVIAVEPARSPVLSGGERGEHQFQGMGPGFVPANFDRSVVDRIQTAWEEDAFPVARRLSREEGVFVGMSSGAIIWTALQLAKTLGTGKRIATISPDSGARYLSTSLFEG